MKRTLTIFGAFALVAAILAFAPAPEVKADAPTISITGPTGTQFVSFPFDTNITMTVQDDSGALDNVNNLTVVVNDGVSSTTLYSGINAFAGGPVCSVQIGGIAGATCQVVAGVGTLTFPWTVLGPGQYTITVTAKHQSATGTDIEIASFQLVAVEHPAPPAEANAYIKATFGKLGAKRQGCVISQIANMHAHDSFFGPKGGPYDIPLIQATVNGLLASSCP
jgi:hypothetical protein